MGTLRIRSGWARKEFITTLGRPPRRVQSWELLIFCWINNILGESSERDVRMQMENQVPPVRAISNAQREKIVLMTAAVRAFDASDLENSIKRMVNSIDGLRIEDIEIDGA
jgi:hypothetical protein